MFDAAEKFREGRGVAWMRGGPEAVLLGTVSVGMLSPKCEGHVPHMVAMQ